MPPSQRASATRTRIILMRHGETDWNRQRRVMGREDVPLNLAGREQCRRTADLLGDLGVTSIVSSPLTRALESATILSDVLGLVVRTEVELEEVHFGRWQGRTYDDVIGDPAYLAFQDDPVLHRTPGGETIADVQRRGMDALRRLAADEATVVVSHGDVIRAMVCELLQVPLREYRRIRIDNCGLTAIEGLDRRPEVKFVNLLADPERAWDPLHWDAGSRA